MRILNALNLAFFAASALTLQAASLPVLHGRCSVGPSEVPGQFSLRVDRDDCDGDGGCGSNFQNDPFSRLSGITRSDLARDGANLTASVTAEAGTFTCAGTVHDGVFSGEATFVPDNAFVERAEQMGFSGFTSEKLEAYTFFDIKFAWIKALQQAGIKGLTADNLIALRIFKVDPEYVAGFRQLGYEVPDADKLIALSVQRVDPAQVRKIRALGFQPSLDELIQIGVFHITPEFIQRMQARGFKDLTISKLVQIKIFKLDE